MLLLTQSFPWVTVNTPLGGQLCFPRGKVNWLYCSALVGSVFFCLLTHKVSCLPLKDNNTSMKGGFFLTKASALSHTVHLSWIHWGMTIYWISGKVIWTFKKFFFQGDDFDLHEVYIYTISHASPAAPSFLFFKTPIYPLNLT